MLQKITDDLDDGNYDQIIDFFKNNTGDIIETIYFQNGKTVSSLLDGQATILLKNGIYVGEVKNSERNGQGKQLGIYTDDYSYTVAQGTWKNDMLNGKATYFEPNISVNSSLEEGKVDFTYEGNFTDNYYDGIISATWQSKTGTYYGTFKADMGKIDLLREENGKYVYLDNGEGYYWYFIDKTALDNWKVWDGRNAK